MITLQNNEITISVNPDLGAGLHSFTYKGKEVLRTATTGTSNPQQQSLFVMLPYCSHIKNGHFNYFGINRAVPKNIADFSDPIHGDGWLAKWQIKKQTPTEVTLTYQHQKSNGFPFDYNAEITYALSKDHLNITLTIHNPSSLPMPCGMGVHPYFLHAKSAQIEFQSTHIWHHKQDPIFDRPYPTPSQWDFSKPRTLTESFDTAFGGWPGIANITYPDEKLRIEITAADIFHHLILYTPSGSDCFCLEPVSNTPDAFNLAAYGVIGTGIQSIGGGQSLSKTLTFTCKNL